MLASCPVSTVNQNTPDSGIQTDSAQSHPALEERQRVFSWLAQRVNTFVRVLRPRMRSAAADYKSRGE